MGGAYWDELPGQTSHPGAVRLSLRGIEMTLATDVGVFGRSRVDRGTKTLLRAAPAPTAGLAAVDVGCGYGRIALAMAVRAATPTVWGVDVNRRALDLTSQNAKPARANGRLWSPAPPPMSTMLAGEGGDAGGGVRG